MDTKNKKFDSWRWGCWDPGDDGYCTFKPTKDIFIRVCSELVLDTAEYGEKRTLKQRFDTVVLRAETDDEAGGEQVLDSSVNVTDEAEVLIEQAPELLKTVKLMTELLVNIALNRSGLDLQGAIRKGKVIINKVENS